MNLIEIFAPRWKDRKVLIAKWKVGAANEIRITATKKDGTRFYPESFYMDGATLNTYPLVAHKHGQMREVPLDDILAATQK